MNRPLAKDANAAVERGLKDCANLGLILDKFQPYQPVNNQRPDLLWDLVMRVEVDKGKRGQQDWRSETRESGEARGLWFGGPPDRKMRLKEPELYPSERVDKEVLEQFRERWRHGVKANAAEIFAMWTESPLIIGLGAKGTLETAITLHPLYGFPYIPGSALKGLARAAAFFELAAKLSIEGVDNATYLRDYYNKQRRLNEPTPLQQLAEALDEKDEEKWPDYLANAPDNVRAEATTFRKLFGWRGEAGRVIFFDGVPIRVPQIVSEVMTPHFKNYYGSDDFPHDAHSPNPISLLAVARETEFYFAVGWRRGPRDAGLHEKAVDWLKRGLTEIGLGGKTAAGYGFFQKDQPKPARDPVKNRPEADVLGYRPPRTDTLTGSGDKGTGRPELEPESDRVKAEAARVKAQLDQAALEREEKERARLARKAVKDSKKKKKK